MTTSRSSSSSSEASLLLGIVLGLVAFGLVMVYSASFIFALERTGDGYVFIKKQLAFSGLGLAALWALQRISYQTIRRHTPALFFGALALLTLVLLPGVGHRVGGAQRWLNLGMFNIQPAEIAKFASVLFVSFQIIRKRDRIHTFTGGVLGQLLLPAVALGLLLLQPDFGSSMIILGVSLCLLFLGGLPLRYLLLLGGGAGLLGGALVASSTYRWHRLMTFLDPWRDPQGKGFQVLQSMAGVQHGKWFGTGLGNSKEKLFYLPEAHNDFIMAVVGEELGFVGFVLVLAAFCGVVFCGFRIGARASERDGSDYPMLVASGISLLLGLQAMINLSVVLGLLPTKGLALPFVSYGGSALVLDLAAVGVLLSISKGHRPSEN